MKKAVTLTILILIMIGLVVGIPDQGITLNLFESADTKSSPTQIFDYQNDEAPIQKTPVRPSSSATGSFQIKKDGEVENVYIFQIETEELELDSADREKVYYSAELRFQLTELGEKVLQKGPEKSEEYIRKEFETHPKEDFGEEIYQDAKKVKTGALNGLKIEERSGNIEKISYGEKTASISVSSDQDFGGIELKFGSFSGAWSLTESLTEASDRVNSVAWGPNGDFLAAGTDDDNVYVHETDDWALVETLTHSSPVNSVAWGPNGDFLAAGTDYDSVYVHETDDWALVETLTEASSPVSSVS